MLSMSRSGLRGDEPLFRPAGVGIAAPAVDLFGPVQQEQLPRLPVGNMAAILAPLNYGPPPAVLRRLPVMGRE